MGIGDPLPDYPGGGDGNGGGGGNGNGGSGGSSSGGSSGPSQAEQNANRNFENSLRVRLQDWGITVNANLNQLISQAVSKKYNWDTFLTYLRKTPEYRDRFAGIYGKNGKLLMSEAQYLSYERSYEDIASRSGLNLNKKTQAWMIRNGVQPSEFADRAPAITRIQTQPVLYAQFAQALEQAGVIKDAKNLKKKDLVEFVLGEKNREWYNVWNLARVRAVAREAGLKITKNLENDLALRPALVETLADRLGGGQLSERELAKKLGEFGEIMSDQFAAGGAKGFSKSQLLGFEFGPAAGKKAQIARGKFKDIKAAQAGEQQGASAEASYDVQGGETYIPGSERRRKAQTL